MWGSGILFLTVAAVSVTGVSAGHLARRLSKFPDDARFSLTGLGGASAGGRASIDPDDLPGSGAPSGQGAVAGGGISVGSVISAGDGASAGDEAAARYDVAIGHDAAAGNTGIFSCSLPGFCGGVPGVFCSFILTGTWKRWRRFRFSIPVRNGKGFLREAPLLRGEYEVRGEVEVRDILSLSRFAVLLPEADTIRVLPADSEPVHIGVPPAAGGARSAGKLMRMRGDEFFDTRKYVPGDDIRRINWKQFAHARELVLRIPERVPPPEARHRIVLDTAAGDRGGVPEGRGAAGRGAAGGKVGAARGRGAAGRGAARGSAETGLLPAVDWLASAALSLARILNDRGLSVSFTFLGGKTYPDIYDPDTAAAILAGAAPRLHDAVKEVESLDRSGLSAAEEVFLFSIASDPDEIPALTLLRERGIEPAVVLCSRTREKSVVPGPFRYAATEKHASEEKHPGAGRRR